VPVLPPLHPTLERHLCEVYAEVSGKPLGEGVGFLRDVVIADTDDEARALWAKGPAFCGAAWFAPFGFDKGVLDPVTGERPSDYFGEGLALAGTVDSVTKGLERVRENVPAQWIFAWMYNGLVPHDRILHTIEAWQTQVVPRIG